MTEEKKTFARVGGKGLIEASVAAFEAEKAKFEERWPLEEDYESSTLRGWLELGRWNPEEGICLLCDIEPNGADISWSGYENYAGARVQLAKINNVNFLGEDGYLYIVPIDHGSDDMDQKYKTYRVQLAERELQRAWRIFQRGDQVFFDYSPIGFIKWAEEKKIEVPWLDWALKHALIDLETQEPAIPEETPTKSTKKSSSTENAELQEEKKQQIAELRMAARKVAVKLKTDGMPDKRITVYRICQDLLSRDFSNGKPFNSRWRSVDGMRSYLKGDHHPKNNNEYRNAKSTRPKFNP